MKMNFGISPAVFREHYQERVPVLIKQAFSPEGSSWKDVNELLARCDVSSNDFKISCKGVRPKEEYVERYWDIGTLRHRLIKPAVYEYLRKGGTLIANKIVNEPWVDRFAKQIVDLTGRQVVSSVYAAFGTRDSFRCHWDTRDVFAVQVVGRKRWVVYEPTFQKPLYTQQSKDYGHLYPCPEIPYMDFVLEAGDVFYLPRGWWHNPSPLGEPTCHIAIGTFPAYSMDYLAWIINRAPEMIEARCSLRHWEDDKANLAAMGQRINKLINDPEIYECFLSEFSGATRVESPLAIEVLGVPPVRAIPECARLRLSLCQAYGFQKNYMIANGVKVNFDEQAGCLLFHVKECPGITVAELKSRCAGVENGKFNELIEGLCRQDVLELLLD